MKAKADEMVELLPERRRKGGLEVFAAFERAANHLDDGMLGIFMRHSIITEHDSDATERYDAWPQQNVRALILAFLINAPKADFDEMVRGARSYEQFADECELQTEYENTTGKSCYGPDFKHWARSRLKARASKRSKGGIASYNALHDRDAARLKQQYVATAARSS